MRNCIIILTFISLAVIVSSAFAEEKESPAAISMYVGTWEGNWSQNDRYFSVVVKKLEAGKFSGIYSWGTGKVELAGNRHLSGSMKVTGEISSNGILELGNSNGVRVTLYTSDGKTALATWSKASYTTLQATAWKK